MLLTNTEEVLLLTASKELSLAHLLPYLANLLEILSDYYLQWYKRVAIGPTVGYPAATVEMDLLDRKPNLYPKLCLIRALREYAPTVTTYFIRSVTEDGRR